MSMGSIKYELKYSQGNLKIYVPVPRNVWEQRELGNNPDYRVQVEIDGVLHAWNVKRSDLKKVLD